MTDFPEFTLAAIQAAPVLFDHEASCEKACRLIGEAAAKGATLAAFGETWLPGYPFFAGNRPSPLTWQASAEYVANAITIRGPETERLCTAARRAGIDVVIGVAERDKRTRGTVYCTLLFIGREGRILGRHRKLKPTHVERTVWGEGDATGLRVHERPYGRISGLNCWEHQMLLPGFALIAQGTQIHIAAWPGREPEQAPAAPVSVWPKQHLLSRAFASQGACYVVAVAGLIRTADVPERYRELLRAEMTGQSIIIDPRGEVIAGPAASGEEEILVARGCSMEAVMAAKAACDAAGHYGRPDLFRLSVSGLEVYPSGTVADVPERRAVAGEGDGRDAAAGGSVGAGGCTAQLRDQADHPLDLPPA
jgi:predicted amidohydrolase